MVKLACIMATLVACIDTDLGSPPYQIEVLTLTGVDPVDGSGVYALASVEMPELLSIDPLHDRDFRFIAQPRIDTSFMGDIPMREWAQTLYAEASYTPRLRNVGGIGVPRDIVSLQVMSAYHAFRQVVAAIPELTGLVAADVLPATGLQVWVHPRFEQRAASQELTANAFYMPWANSFGLVDIDPIERLPVGALPAVLAHEFGHHLFHQSFGVNEGACDDTDSTTDNPGWFSRDLAIAGFNEGFADLVSFAVTGVTNPVSDAYVLDFGDRALDVRLDGAMELGIDDCGDDDRYCIGTLFARSLVEAAVARGEDVHDRAVRMMLARQAFNVFARMPAALRAHLTWESLAPCVKSSRFYFDVVSAVLAIYVAEIPAEHRASVCERFIANFGDTGFVPTDRGGCP